jgi:hypothetical protein
MPVRGLEAHNPHVCLYMMTGDFFGASVRVNGSPADIARQMPEPVANEIITKLFALADFFGCVNKILAT